MYRCDECTKMSFVHKESVQNLKTFIDPQDPYERNDLSEGLSRDDPIQLLEKE